MAYNALKKMRQMNMKNPLLSKYGELIGPLEPVLQKMAEHDLCSAALTFLHDRCTDLRFHMEITAREMENGALEGVSVKKGQIPYNMQMDIDRLCLERATERFLKSGMREDAFDVYFCYLEMFIGRYEKSRRMMELLSEFEKNSNAVIMKHRDIYSYSVYVFLLGLAIYETNDSYRNAYEKKYALVSEQEAAHHFLKYWGLAALFHDIGYSFELPFEQVCSCFGDMEVAIRLKTTDFTGKQAHILNSNFIHLYDFAVALNAQYNALEEDDETMLESFEQLSLEYKLSNFLQAKEFEKHLGSIGYLCTDKPADYSMVKEFSDSDLVTLGIREHLRWENEKRNMCWLPAGEVSEVVKDKDLREQTRMHDDLNIRFIDLPREEQIKDMKPLNTMLKKLEEFDGVRIYKLK